jgi:5-formyltetrahydrofolate cyclo-ligase
VSTAGADDKSRLRTEISRALANVPESRWRDASANVCERLLSMFAIQHARHVMLYAPMPREVDVSALAGELGRMGTGVWVPRVDWAGGSMHVAEVPRGDFSLLVSGQGGTREPGPDARLLPSGDLDIIIVPGRAFDASGGRLGRGRGFYDRFLTAPGVRALKIGVAIEEQIAASVPMEVLDARMDAVVTDARVLKPGP